MSTTADTLGDRILHLRRAAGLTAQQVAERAGCSEDTMTRLERNRTTPTLRTLDAVASVLGTTTVALLGGAEGERQRYAEHLKMDIVETISRLAADNPEGVDPIVLQAFHQLYEETSREADEP